MSLLKFFKKPSTDPSSQKLVKNTVLVVDDEEYLRDFYKDLLLRQGYEVMTATNGQEALDAVNQKQPQLIILDIMMPVMDGLDVLRVLWNNNMTKKIPVIVLTNAGDISNMDKAKFYSTYKFFIKSNVQPEEIIKAVDEALNTNTTVA